MTIRERIELDQRYGFSIESHQGIPPDDKITTYHWPGKQTLSDRLPNFYSVMAWILYFSGIAKVALWHDLPWGIYLTALAIFAQTLQIKEEI